jgi:E3 ubiquitin-protein ligase listerin
MLQGANLGCNAPDALRNCLDRLSRSLLAHGLDSDHVGSSHEYIDTLNALTQFEPTIWTDHYSSKKSASKRLRSFLKRGSQGGSREYWPSVCNLFRCLPDPLFPAEASDLTELLGAFHAGIVRKEEPRANLTAAFTAFVTVVGITTSHLPAGERSAVLRDMLWPLFRQYLNPTAADSQWTVPGAQAAEVIGKAVTIAGLSEILQAEWRSISSELIDGIKASAPEQSKDYEKSQITISERGTKWAVLQKEILKAKPDENTRQTIILSCSTVIKEALTCLDSRNGKPYGAAAVVESLLANIGEVLFANGEISKELELFFSHNAANLFLSPSMPRLVSILYLSYYQSWFKDAWTTISKQIISSPPSSHRDAAIIELASSPKMPESFELVVLDSDFQRFLLQRLSRMVNGDIDAALASRILKNSSRLLSSNTSGQLLVELTENLSLAENSESSLRGIELITKQSPDMLRDFLTKPQGSELLQHLLLLTESASTKVAQEASALNNTIQILLSQKSNDPASRTALVAIIRRGLSEATISSVTVETLVDVAQRLLNETNAEELTYDIIPSLSAWESALDDFLNHPPDVSLAISDQLGGTLYLVPPTTSSSASVEQSKINRDINGFSSAYRMASYFTKLVQSTKVFDSISNTNMSTLFSLLALTASLANDNLSLAGSNGLWNKYTPEVEADAMEFVSETQALLTEWLRKSNEWWSESNRTSQFSFVETALQACLDASKGISAASYYNARVYSVNMAELIEMHGWHSSKTSFLEATVKEVKNTKDSFYAAAFLTGCRIPLSSSKASTLLCNGIVADLTGFDPNKDIERVLRHIVLLNLIMSNYENISESIAKQRVIFLVKHVVKWLEDGSFPVALKAETCRLLSYLLILMKDIYGEHWEILLSFITTFWSSANRVDAGASQEQANLPIIHASMKLYSTLESLSMDDEPNDDLIDAWKDTEESAAKGLITLLKHSQHFPDEFHQPLRIVNELLARLVSRVPLKRIDDPADLFPLLYVASGPVQKTAFQILHKQIPAAQEQISLDTALDNKKAHLPDELLSLILEAPTINDFADADFERSMPLPLRGYLFSWILLFDHFENSSYKVKSDYLEQIKDGDYIRGLLDFTFDFLGHGKGKPVDVSKFDVTSYTPDIEESPKKDAQWLLTYLYFLCLKHVPSLAKSWWIDCKAQQKVIAVESWTGKYVSQLFLEIQILH